MALGLLKRHKFIFGIIILIILVVLFWIMGIDQDNREKMVGQISDTEKEESWLTYTNEVYNFSLDFPSTWQVYEHIVDANPVINIYKPEFGAEDPPYDHFSEITNVSIFPNGLPTEGIIGDFQDSSVNIHPPITKSNDYLLNNGDVWSSMVTFENPPDSWQEWGFIWANTKIENLDHGCKRGIEEISIDKCNPFEGDRFVRYGSSDQKVREIEIKILESFRFN